MNESVPETSLTTDILRYLRYQLRGRRGLVASGLGAAAVSLWFGWPWLAAAGLAPILVAIAPCAIMCALGFCTMKACSTAARSPDSATPPDVLQVPEPPASAETVEDAALPVPAAIPLQPRADLAETSRRAGAEDATSTDEAINQGKENSR
jgi:hypothetical protein